MADVTPEGHAEQLAGPWVDYTWLLQRGVQRGWLDWAVRDGKVRQVWSEHVRGAIFYWPDVRRLQVEEVESTLLRKPTRETWL